MVWGWVKEGDMKTSVNNRDSGRTPGTPSTKKTGRKGTVKLLGEHVEAALKREQWCLRVSVFRGSFCYLMMPIIDLEFYQ